MTEEWLEKVDNLDGIVIVDAVSSVIVVVSSEVSELSEAAELISEEIELSF